jgi:hypothetical protein
MPDERLPIRFTPARNVSLEASGSEAIYSIPAVARMN